MPTHTFDVSKLKLDCRMTDVPAPWAGDDPKHPWRGNSWLCKLTYQRRQLTVPFFTGELAGEPTARSVLACLVMDAQGINAARSFDDWCAEYGYDTDSRKAERIYKACQNTARRLDHFLPDWRALDTSELDS